MIEREIHVEVKPTIEEIAKAIWDMDAEEQYQLLGELFVNFFEDELFGNEQLIAIREQLNKDVNRQFATGVMTFVFRLYEYVYEKE